MPVVLKNPGFSTRAAFRTSSVDWEAQGRTPPGVSLNRRLRRAYWTIKLRCDAASRTDESVCTVFP